MNRSRHAVAALALLGLLSLPLQAQKPEEETPARDEEQATTAGEASEIDGLGTDAAARAAYGMLSQGKHIDAREAAERILRKDPRSYAGHYVLGYVLHRAESNLPLALYHLKQARRIFEARYKAKPTAEEPWLWHSSTLEELASVAAEMGLHQERLTYLAARDDAYDPKWPAERGWPLMRLRRYDEARKAVEEAMTGDQPDQISTAKTTLCAIESELLHRQAAYQACSEAATYDRDSNQGGPHTFTNAAGAAMSLLKMDEAESLILEGTKHFQVGATSNPWMHLMGLYLAEGRSGEALDAVREMFTWQGSQPAYMDEQARAETEFASAMFLLLVGRAADAVKILDRTLQRPDRTGFTSAESEQMEAATALLDRLANLVAAERKDEEAACSGWGGWLKARMEARKLRLKAWESSRQAASLIHSDRMLLATLRPYLAGGVAIPEWMEGDLCAVMGPGVVGAALEKARKAEDLPEAGAYFDAFEAEVALLQGRNADALRLAKQALEKLPTSEALLQARTAALGGAAALEEGKPAEAVDLLDRALQRDPGVIRRLGLALPCSFSATSGEVAAATVELLRRSPRFREERSGFSVRVEGTSDSGTACLFGPKGEVLVCAEVTPRAGESTEGVSQRLAAELHEQAFAPRVDLTQSDLRTLDGSTMTGGGRSAKRFKSVLDQLVGGSEGEKEPE